MNCEKCGKNIATIHKVFIINGKITEYDLCYFCDKIPFNEMKKFQESLNLIDPFINRSFNKQNIFSNFKKQKYTEDITDLLSGKENNEKTELENLEKKLKQAINVEDYEGAAVIRDKIINLKNTKKSKE